MTSGHIREGGRARAREGERSGKGAWSRAAAVGNRAHDHRDPQKNRVVHAAALLRPLWVEGHLCKHETSLPSSWPCTWAQQSPMGQRQPEQPREIQFLQRPVGGFSGTVHGGWLPVNSGMVPGALGWGPRVLLYLPNSYCPNILDPHVFPGNSTPDPRPERSRSSRASICASLVYRCPSSI